MVHKIDSMLVTKYDANDDCRLEMVARVKGWRMALGRQSPKFQGARLHLAPQRLTVYAQDRQRDIWMAQPLQIVERILWLAALGVSVERDGCHPGCASEF
jgi:hypothetical protein